MQIIKLMDLLFEDYTSDGDDGDENQTSTSPQSTDQSTDSTTSRQNTNPERTHSNSVMIANSKSAQQSTSHYNAQQLLQQHVPKYNDNIPDSHRMYHNPETQVGQSHYDFPTDLAWKYQDAQDAYLNNPADSTKQYYDSTNKVKYNDPTKGLKDNFPSKYDTFRTAYKSHYGTDLPAYNHEEY